MKVRIRTPDGGTLRMEVEPDDSVGKLLSLALAEFTATGATMLSLNKKDSLNESTSLRDCGVRGGDLLHLLCIRDTAMGDAGAAAASSGSRGSASANSSSPSQSAASNAASNRSPFGLSTVIYITKCAHKEHKAYLHTVLYRTVIFFSSDGVSVFTIPTFFMIFVFCVSPPAHIACMLQMTHTVHDIQSAPIGTTPQASTTTSSSRVVDQRGRLWEETVTQIGSSSSSSTSSSSSAAAAAAKSAMGNAEEERLKRIRAIENRTSGAASHLNKKNTDMNAKLAPVSGSSHAQYGDPMQIDAGASQRQNAGLQREIEMLARREGVAAWSRPELCVLAMHCLLTKEGFGNDELPSGCVSFMYIRVTFILRA
jgi:hypothetical protein